MSAEAQSSYRRIVASTSIIGGATVATILIGILRTKILAVLAGPEGIGLLGLLANITALVAAVANFGLAFSAVREIAGAQSDRRKAEIRRALWVASLPLALLGGLLLWLGREPITRLAADDQSLSLLVGLSGILVFLSVIGLVQQCVLQGLQRMKALGWIKIGGALLSTLIAIPAVALLPGKGGLFIAALALPLGVVLVSLPFAPRDLPAVPALARHLTRSTVTLLLRVGAVVTLTTTISQLGLLAVRALVVRESGFDVAGLYQAVITITTMNITLILGAMSADYYPRLSAHRNDPAAANRIFNDQLHVALLLGTPLLIALIAGAPLVLRILYTSEFAGAEAMLRWQLLGDFLKMPGWAMGYVLLAFGRRKGMLLSELVATTVLLGGAYLLLLSFGLEGAGMAYVASYLLYGLLVTFMCARLGVRPDRSNATLLLVGVALGGSIFLLALKSEPLALGAGVLLAAATAVQAVRELIGRTGWRKGREGI